MDNWFVLAAILILCMVGIKPCSNLENGLSIEQSRIIKGLAALILVCVHIGNSLSNDGVFGVLSAGGYLFVSLFFFYSGYGTFIGLKKSTGNVGGGYTIPSATYLETDKIADYNRNYLFYCICDIRKN